jgi:hypothetical protein
MGTLFLGGVAMKLRKATLNEVVSLAVAKLSKASEQKQKRETVVYLPARVLPPQNLKPYRWITAGTNYGEAEFFLLPHCEAGWLIKVRFRRPLIFNPPVSPSVGEEILKKIE